MAASRLGAFFIRSETTMSVPYSPWRAALYAAALSLSVLSVPAHAFSDDEARRAILDLRQQIKQMNDRNQQARFQLADQIESMRHEITSLRGQIERLNFELEVAKRSGQEDGPGASVQVSNPQEQAAFEAPMQQFRGGQYKEAATGFAGFLTTYPESQLASDARFYRGSSLYASKDFASAIKELQSLVQANPTDPRAPDALLIVAASQIEQNQMDGAKASLQRIVKEYPQSAAAETAKNRLELLQ